MPIPNAGAGAKTFLKLADTPDSYVGQARKVARVVSGETALEFGMPKLEFSNFYDGTVPTDAPWVFESPVPFTPTAPLYFSPIKIEGQNKYVYVIDRGTNFYRYNITTKDWAKLANPNYTAENCYRSLVPNPGWTELWCISEGGATEPVGKRLSKYTIATNIWTASSQITDVSYQLRALVFADADTIWCWTKKQAVNRGKCVKYVPSTDTWTIYANEPASQTVWIPSCAAIKADGSVVYVGRCGTSGGNYFTYTPATDTYAVGVDHSGFNYIWVADHDRLWYYRTSPANYRYGYLFISDLSFHDDAAPQNTDLDAGYGAAIGVSSDATNIFSYAKGTNPYCMSYTGAGTWLLATLTLTQFAIVTIDKPVDSFYVTASEAVLQRTISFGNYASATLKAGTWKFYYPKDGDYTKIKLYYTPLEGG